MTEHMTSTAVRHMAMTDVRVQSIMNLPVQLDMLDTWKDCSSTAVYSNAATMSVHGIVSAGM